MAGLLYLPRIFVYHAEKISDKNISETFKVMEQKLMNFIMMPAMILSWIFGILLILINGEAIYVSMWLSLKLVFVLLLTIYHFFLKYCIMKFVNNKNLYSSKFYRIINEIPAVLLIIVIFVIIYKPI